MKLSLRYFASVREAIGTASETIDTEATTLGALREQLIDRGGRHAEALSRERALRMAIDQVMADETTALREGAEVAFFPPVTGG
ncbi:molybdopterin converting factor subunit 1 [Ramlibacter rhizophilus]|uniref:Molybdopterin synthase sulfur carrier subunit n=1 Tax=Ramlibacter rhizophilus TaxID=1781167 RepID=A0A4Z0BJ39_9BURK|nr:molybdopterin converting factor subunit 1 [Ramlibacter rhizophilus]TFY98781.1 molybdopterin converting factor subunit 1 [Ramlibacter rhizophilus]